jgi:hypothetical protein
MIMSRKTVIELVQATYLIDRFTAEKGREPTNTDELEAWVEQLDPQTFKNGFEQWFRQQDKGARGSLAPRWVVAWK